MIGDIMVQYIQRTYSDNWKIKIFQSCVPYLIRC